MSGSLWTTVAVFGIEPSVHFTAPLSISLFARLEGAAQFVGEQSEAFRRCRVLRFDIVRRAAARALGQERNADPLLLEVDGQDLERPSHPPRDLRGPIGRSACWSERR